MSDARTRTRDQYAPSEAWKADAACAGVDPNVFYPPPSPDPDIYRARIREITNYCSGCPVRTECARYAVREGITEGVWGGLSPAARTNITFFTLVDQSHTL